MVTIKTIWLYVIILAATAGGFGAGYIIPSADVDMMRQLNLANEQIERLAVNCAGEKEAFKQTPIVQSPSRGF